MALRIIHLVEERRNYRWDQYTYVGFDRSKDMYLPMRMRVRMLRLIRLAPRRPRGWQRRRAAIRHATTWSESSERGRYRWTIDRWPRELRKVYTRGGRVLEPAQIAWLWMLCPHGLCPCGNANAFSNGFLTAHRPTAGLSLMDPLLNCTVV